jgi:hypothetical protein
VRRVRSALAFWARISYASRLGWLQKAIAAMWGGKHRVGAARGRILGEYPKTNKCWSMLVSPAMIASWRGEDVQKNECFRMSGSLRDVGLTIHQDSSGPAARTWSNN